MDDSHLAMSPSPTCIQRDADLWFPDGNVVLEASGYGFRVYQGLLARDSPFFADLFSLPQPSHAELLEGCPVVHLTDFYEDLRILLRVQLGSGRSSDRDSRLLDGTRIDFPTTDALIRLGRKYQIDGLYNDALDVLKTFLSAQYGSWYEKLPYLEWGRYALDPIAAVNLARLTDTLSILPVAMYLCCQLRTEDLLRGTTYSDGTSQQLSLDDLRRCVDARVFLTREKDAAFERIFDLSASDSCSDSNSCRERLEYRMAIYKKQVTDVTAGWNISGPWLPYVWLKNCSSERGYGEPPLCSHCMALLESQHRDVCTKMWGDLPRYFDLEVSE
ncbi:hypothetical protein DAEQUDRAFT_246684 [Daedalea quercina L-15889]|uniref:BTB domain-containing protein n=1 Tax=Daedalea quercina L-15889 TaxID=1314783 RepID=A0A165QLU8_9APHY|nr:hypothetical protein DAEQUDRAFT_246684 [Daedalea quercina L-15889]